MKLKPDTDLQAFKDEIMSGLRAHKQSSQWTRDDGEFIPFPHNFLKDRRWEWPAIPTKGDRLRQRTPDVLTRGMDEPETAEEYNAKMGWIQCATCNCAHRPGFCPAGEFCDLCRSSHKAGECPLNNLVAHYAAYPRRKLEASDEKGCGICRGNDGYDPELGEGYFVCDEHKRRWRNKNINGKAPPNGNRDHL